MSSPKLFDKSLAPLKISLLKDEEWDHEWQRNTGRRSAFLLFSMSFAIDVEKIHVSEYHALIESAKE